MTSSKPTKPTRQEWDKNLSMDEIKQRGKIPIAETDPRFIASNKPGDWKGCVHLYDGEMSCYPHMWRGDGKVYCGDDDAFKRLGTVKEKSTGAGAKAVSGGGKPALTKEAVIPPAEEPKPKKKETNVAKGAKAATATTETDKKKVDEAKTNKKNPNEVKPKKVTVSKKTTPVAEQQPPAAEPKEQEETPKDEKEQEAPDGKGQREEMVEEKSPTADSGPTPVTMDVDPAPVSATAQTPAVKPSSSSSSTGNKRKRENVPVAPEKKQTVAAAAAPASSPAPVPVAVTKTSNSSSKPAPSKVATPLPSAGVAPFLTDQQKADILASGEKIDRVYSIFSKAAETIGASFEIFRSGIADGIEALTAMADAQKRELVELDKFMARNAERQKEMNARASAVMSILDPVRDAESK